MSNVEIPGAIDRFLIRPETLRHRRLLTTLVRLAIDSGRAEPRYRLPGHTWQQSVIALTDQPEYDTYEFLVDELIVDGDLETALQALTASAIRWMTSDCEPMEYDAALAHNGRILSVIRNSPCGPVLTRLDTGSPPSYGESSRVQFAADQARSDDDVRRTRWVSTAQTRATAHCAFEVDGRWGGDWIRRVTAMIDGPDSYRARALPTEIYADPSLPEKVEVAITVACEAMMPVIDDRVPLDPDHPEPLTCDVALACAGRIHAVVQCTKSGPVVIRFADLWPSMV